MQCLSEGKQTLICFQRKLSFCHLTWLHYNNYLANLCNYRRFERGKNLKLRKIDNGMVLAGILWHCRRFYVPSKN